MATSYGLAVANIVGIAPADIADERSRMSDVVFARTRNRSLLGTLTDYALMARHGAEWRNQPETPEELMRFLDLQGDASHRLRGDARPLPPGGTSSATTRP
jgi:hypothetical protein